MEDLEWIDFIKKIIAKGKNVNLKEECKKKQVSLNTLYRKVSKLEQLDSKLYNEFVNIHPYKPRNRDEYNYEQFMRESILTGISQEGLEAKYHIPKRTIQRKFTKIKKENFELYSIYRLYTRLKRGETLSYDVLDKIESEYVPQTLKSEKETLEVRREKFINSMNRASEKKDKNLKNHYREQIDLIDRHIKHLEEKGEEK